MIHRLYFSPGMFGFGRLASYDYFVHLERALVERLHTEGIEAETHVVQVAPTASIRRRALKLTELVASTCGDDAGPIHLIGHSTGGLDARLVASPSVALAVLPEKLAWRARLASVTTINAPHYGTPLASFFTTVSGERMLRVLSALTVVALSVGSTPLAVVGGFIALFVGIDRRFGLDLKLIDRTTDALLRTIDQVRGQEIRAYLDAIKEDNGAMVQLMPEAMDLFIAGVEDRPGVLYQSTASMAPPPSTRTFVRSLGGRWSAVSGLLFDFLYEITSRSDSRYPCSAPDCNEANERAMVDRFGKMPDFRANDGVVPIRSQIWGTLIWTGYADHLDVIGHFRGAKPSPARDSVSGPPPHVDWLCSGSTFDVERFGAMVDAIALGIAASIAARPVQDG
jgi:triacylglycerol esterase/lipase EstA (alpha/beta hydrolase family)